MSRKNLTKIGVFLCAALFAAACGGRSDVIGEVVPIERVCAYEKARTVAVEGFLAPHTMQCERASNKKSSGITGCTFDVYANSDQTGAAIPVFISTGGWIGGKNNRILDPAGYTGNMQFYDGKGNPLPKKELQIYDNEGNLIPAGSKIRIYSQLPRSDKCEFRLAEKIELVGEEAKRVEAVKYSRNLTIESF